MKIYTIKKTSRNRQALYIDTLENLTTRLQTFIIPAVVKTPRRGRKAAQEADGPVTFKTPAALVAALNDSCLRAGSEDIRYELA